MTVPSGPALLGLPLLSILSVGLTKGSALATAAEGEPPSQNKKLGVGRDYQSQHVYNGQGGPSVRKSLESRGEQAAIKNVLSGQLGDQGVPGSRQPPATAVCASSSPRSNIYAGPGTGSQENTGLQQM